MAAVHLFIRSRRTDIFRGIGYCFEVGITKSEVSCAQEMVMDTALRILLVHVPALDIYIFSYALGLA